MNVARPSSYRPAGLGIQPRASTIFRFSGSSAAGQVADGLFRSLFAAVAHAQFVQDERRVVGKSRAAFWVRRHRMGVFSLFMAT